MRCILILGLYASLAIILTGVTSQATRADTSTATTTPNGKKA